MEINVPEINKDVIIYCASYYGEMAYCEAKAQGYTICVFCDNSINNYRKKIMGIEVYNYEECKKRFHNAIYIIAHKNYATAKEIGFSLESDGFVLNQSYFIAIELENRNILKTDISVFRNILEPNRIILIGEKYLCEMFFGWCKNYLKISTEKISICYQENIRENMEKYPEALWIPLAKERFDSDKSQEMELCNLLNEKGIKNISRLFLQYMFYYKNDVKQYTGTGIKIVFLKMSCYSGSIFFSSILDSHPDIFYLGHKVWAWNIWSIVKNAAYEGTGIKVVQSVISQIKKYEQSDDVWINEFGKILELYFNEKRTYSEQEIFLNIYFAYYEVMHKKEYVKKKEYTPVIFMDIHANEKIHDAMLFWLKNLGFDVFLCELIRNPIMRLGSFIKYALYGEGEYDLDKKVHCNLILNNLHILVQEIMSEEEKKNEILRIRFEDLKLHSKTVLTKLCNILDIPWNDSLLKTTMAGKKSEYSCAGNVTTGFDIKPVYYPYNEYFDAFDKFRLDMLFREKLSTYGYSYVEKEKYEDCDFDIFHLFSIPFQFESYLMFETDQDKSKFRKDFALLCSYLIEMNDHLEDYKENYCYGKYIMVD